MGIDAIVCAISTFLYLPDKADAAVSVEKGYKVLH